MHERVSTIEHRETPIIAIDFSGLADPADIAAVISRAKRTIHAAPPASLLTLTDVSGMRFNPEITLAMREFADSNKPFVQAAALLGVSGLKQVVFNTVKRLSGRRIEAFDDPATAKDWLVAHRRR
jgi:hypothetical protein